MLKITGVEKYKGSTYMIEFEDREPEFINVEIVRQFNLKAGASLPESAWEQVKSENEYRKARERALYLLDYRDYSYIELFHKLEKNYSEETCYRVMDKMAELGTIDDRRYARGLARHYVEVKKCGRYKAFQQMKLKGLTNEIINDALDEFEEGTYDRLKELAEKKIGRYLGTDNGMSKFKNYLVRQGYSYGLVKEVVDDVMAEYEDE